MALPNTWSAEDKSEVLSVSPDGLTVNYTGYSLDNAMIRANCPIPPQCKLFYFEIQIDCDGDDNLIGIGFCAQEARLNNLPGWEGDSFGYHSDDGYFHHTESEQYGPFFSTGDIIGCCLNFRVFFTKNGLHLGNKSIDLKNTLYPCVGLGSHGASIKVNFNGKKFAYEAIFYDNFNKTFVDIEWLITEMKERNTLLEKKLTNNKQSKEEELSELKKMNEKTLEDMKKDLETKFQMTIQSKEEELNELKKTSKKTLEDVKKALKAEFQKNIQDKEKELETLKKANEKMLKGHPTNLHKNNQQKLISIKEN
ncbi:concanavalin A-like lectin/glucanase domain-containing protein [Gigaspora rosea]|uniref:Concanavalin A-like lectin/glucanase domain-containing protein n=1 Tax=Gigaspora rosea TaxID=44941 RepID=A0A397U9E9_9GLOM|nr:concanavalin A-like lectin/glucanase domain-containing protein [Gigaspora rosea]